ncbi:hypothetical protein JHS3_15810 [Jeongeupia sp. HS-3]|uniref:cytochrome oxidase putative small subunit CydP n=1 Tax=Jeongeupia sp. HS-3 TaxID=1009682 RepID=UPI0018A65594|nr:cytochrome oxidase putative small subunit CydP [Jeongeupia sp. HS-3]BCL75845.1 hypothetical protein JHS3_15810 [Jeongeupia sp. HS-3]
MKRRTGLPLWLEITVILLIKCLLLYGAWKLWFAEPMAKNMTVPDRAINQQLLGGSTTMPANLPSSGDTDVTRR